VTVAVWVGVGGTLVRVAVGVAVSGWAVFVGVGVLVKVGVGVEVGVGVAEGSLDPASALTFPSRETKYAVLPLPRRIPSSKTTRTKRRVPSRAAFVVR
jgi:hypothetical protein